MRLTTCRKIEKQELVHKRDQTVRIISQNKTSHNTQNI